MDSQEAIYVTFRGSTSIEDWIGNFHVRYTDYSRCKGCWVHDGFYDAEQTVIEDIIAHTRELKKHYPNYTVVVTGHSLGAAVQRRVSWCLCLITHQCFSQVEPWPH